MKEKERKKRFLLNPKVGTQVPEAKHALPSLEEFLERKINSLVRKQKRHRASEPY